MITGTYPGQETVKQKGWLRASKWLILRRLSQLSVLFIFLSGPWFGIWIAKGNLASSLTLDMLPLTDPYVLLQSLFAGHLAETVAVSGAAIVLVFYFFVGGRAYCSWVCPLNIVTDSANRLRDRFKLKGGASFSRATRYWLLVMTLLLAAFSGTIMWELINPVSITFRGLIFGLGLGWLMILAVFIFDLFISRQGWCGHLCPVGAFYSLVGKYSLLRISASNRQQCDDCMDCFTVCPEKQVIAPALKGADKGLGPVIFSANCTNCARCIDVCAKNVFEFTTRFNNSIKPL